MFSLRSFFFSFLQGKILIVIFMFCAVCILSCGKEKSVSLDEGLSLYRQNKLEEALPIFESVVEKEKGNPDAFAWLAETYRRLDMKDKAVSAAQKAMDLDPCHSFAYTVLGFAYNPMYGKWGKADSDSAWVSLLKAVECDSSDGNPWIGIWPEAIRRGDRYMEKRAIRSLIQTGFFTKALLSYNRWLLQHLPENAILLTNGDMDTYPSVALQEVENYRTDVAIVNYSLLNTPWYARFVRDEYGVKLPFTDSELEGLKAGRDERGRLRTTAHQILGNWLKMRKNGTLDRPIAISVTVSDLSFAADAQDHLKLSGAYQLWSPEPVEAPEDTLMMRKSLASINPDDFAGSFVSAQDRSSVRIASSDRIVINITDLALRYSKELLDAQRNSEAYQILTWAEEFEKKTKLGPVFSGAIEKIKEVASSRGE